MLYMHCLIYSSDQLGTVVFIIPILHIRKLRHRNNKPSQGHVVTRIYLTLDLPGLQSPPFFLKEPVKLGRCCVYR